MYGRRLRESSGCHLPPPRDGEARREGAGWAEGRTPPFGRTVSWQQLYLPVPRTRFFTRTWIISPFSILPRPAKGLLELGRDRKELRTPIFVRHGGGRFNMDFVLTMKSLIPMHLKYNPYIIPKLTWRHFVSHWFLQHLLRSGQDPQSLQAWSRVWGQELPATQPSSAGHARTGWGRDGAQACNLKCFGGRFRDVDAGKNQGLGWAVTIKGMAPLPARYESQDRWLSSLCLTPTPRSKGRTRPAINSASCSVCRRPKTHPPRLFELINNKNRILKWGGGGRKVT